MAQPPPEVVEKLAKMNEALKNLTKAVKEFTSIPYEEIQQKPAIEQAELHMAALYATTSIASANERLTGHNPMDNDELQLEIRRVQKLEMRLKEQRERHLRPRLNQFAAKAFVRNATFNVNDSSIGDDCGDWHGPDDSEAIEKEKKEEKMET